MDEQEFQSYRSKFGNLILLTMDVNRSLKDKSYKEKVAVYARQNILAGTLSQSFYQNNPSYKNFEEKYGLNSNLMMILGRNK